MLGDFELYSAKVRKPASIAISRTSCELPLVTLGNRSAGVAISNATRTPRATAPIIRAITSLSLQTGQLRYVPHTCSNLIPPILTVCLILAPFVPSFATRLKVLLELFENMYCFVWWGGAFLHQRGATIVSSVRFATRCCGRNECAHMCLKGLPEFQACLGPPGLDPWALNLGCGFECIEYLRRQI